MTDLINKIKNHSINKMNNFANKLAFLAVGAFAGVADYPGDYCCHVFRDVDYEGDSKNLCLT